MFSQEERRERTFPLERAVLFSLALHVILFFLILAAPPRGSSDPRKGLLGALVPPDEEEVRIPVRFLEAPGPARENAKPSPLSDLDRRAGGGDPSRGRSSRPFVPPEQGISGLSPGPSGGNPSQARQAAEGQGENDNETSDSAERPLVDGETSESDFALRVPEQRERGRLAGLDQAIREAAQGAGTGDEGAGFPNPDGGFVDSGPLSFDTTWYDWGPYAAEMVRRIKLHWDIPSLARLGWKGKLTIRFFILADGRVEGAIIIRGSGVPPFDFAALQAILKSSPFKPLPKDLGSAREGVTVTFYYNIRPGSDAAPESPR